MTREEALKKIKAEMQMYDEESYESVEWEECYEALKQESGWIPVSDRLPEESTAVLIWCPERKNIYCAYFEEKQWWIFGAYFQKVQFEVIAWMPLPKPYKVESEE